MTTKSNKTIEQEEAKDNESKTNTAAKKQAEQEKATAEKLVDTNTVTPENRVAPPPNAPYAGVTEQGANLASANQTPFNDRRDQRPTVAQQTDGQDASNYSNPQGERASDYEPLKGEPGNEQDTDDDEDKPGDDAATRDKKAQLRASRAAQAASKPAKKK